MEQLTSVSLIIQVNPDSGAFSIQARDPRFPCLENIQLGCEYTVAGKKQRCDREMVAALLFVHFRKIWR